MIFALRIVIGRVAILVHVEAGEPPRARPAGGIVGTAQAYE